MPLRPLTPTRLMIALLIGGGLVRLWLASTIGLGVDESYMVAIARHWSLSYFDHPPLAFWLVGATRWLVGSESAALLRLPFILLFAGSSWLLFRLTAKQFGEWAGWYSALLFNLAPVFTLSTASWILPDGLLIFWWLVSLSCLLRVVPSNPSHDHQPAIWGWWLASGIALGLAMLSKYTAVFLPLAVLVFLLSHPHHRRWLRHPAPWVAAALAIALFSPVIIWNSQHQWISLAFQGNRGMPSATQAVIALYPEKMAAALAGQAAYLLPWLWLPLMIVLLRAFGRGLRDSSARVSPAWLCSVSAVIMIGFFALTALWAGGRILPHWPSPGYLMALPLLGAAIDAARLNPLANRLASIRLFTPGRRLIDRWLWGSGAILLLLILLLRWNMDSGWAQRHWPALMRQDPTVELMDWDALPNALAARGLLDHPRLLVASPHWAQAGKIDRALAGRLPVQCLGDDPRHYGMLADRDRYRGWDVLLVLVKKSHEAHPTLAEEQQQFGRYADGLAPLTTVPVGQADYPSLQLYLYWGKNFNGLP